MHASFHAECHKHGPVILTLCPVGHCRDFMCSTVHPNLVGHTYMADLVIGWMQTRMVDMLENEWLAEVGGAIRPAGPADYQVSGHPTLTGSSPGCPLLRFST